MQPSAPENQQPDTTSLIKAGNASCEAPPPLVLKMGGAEQNTAGAFSFGILWHAVRQRLAVSIPLGIVLATAACAALWRFTEDKYRSASTLKIIDKQPFLAFPNQEKSLSFAETQVELLRGPHIIGRALEGEGLSRLPELREIAGKQDPVLWVKTRLKVARIGKSELYEVSMVARKPESAQKIVAAVVNTYKNFQSAEFDLHRQRLMEILKDEEFGKGIEIEQKRQRLRDITRQGGGDSQNDNTTSQAMGQALLLSALQQRLVDAEVELEIQQAQLETLREKTTAGAAAISDEEVQTLLAKHPDTLKLESAVIANQKLLKTVQENSEIYKSYDERLKRAERELESHRTSFPIRHAQHLSKQQEEFLAKKEREIANQAKLVKLFRERIAALQKQQIEHGDNSLETQFAQDELKRVEDIARRITDRHVEIKTESRAPSQVMIIEEARLPDFPDGPSLAKKLAMLGAVALFAPLGLFVGWDLAFRRVFQPEQLQQEMCLKFVGAIAALPTRSLRSGLRASKAFQKQASAYEESVNNLRTTLSVDEKLDDARVFVISSAISGEGKTNLSSQLAMSWSNILPGKIIVVDADMRSPGLHELFEVPAGPGLAEVLRGECQLEDAIVMDCGRQLYILPAGAAGSASASQLCASSRFQEVVARLRSQYLKVIIDTPPVLLANESLLIAKVADGVLICGLRDYSRAGQVKQAYDRLAHAGVNVVGGVLNGASLQSYNYYGYGPN